MDARCERHKAIFVISIWRMMLGLWLVSVLLVLLPRPGWRLLVRRTDGTVESFGPHGTVLGLRDDSGSDLEQSKTVLKAGEVALLYTDGLFGFRLPDGERFSHKAVETHLPRIAPGKEFLERLLAGLKDQSDGTGSDDDMAAIGLMKVG